MRCNNTSRAFTLTLCLLLASAAQGSPRQEQRIVTDGFAIDVTEVTIEQFARFMASRDGARGQFDRR